MGWFLTAVALGMATGTFTYAMTQGVFAHSVFERSNYRDHTLPTAVGVVIGLAMIFAAAAVQLLRAAAFSFSADVAQTIGDKLGNSLMVGLFAVPFVMLGLLDDLVGYGQSGGFRGHLTGIRHGEFSSGALKLVGGACLGILGAVIWGSSNNVWDLLRDGAMLALWANVGNLFDRAPGRASKVCLFATVFIFALANATDGVMPEGGIVVLFGVCLALLWPDLRERCMLGDAGSNVLGAMVGLAALTSFGTTGRWVALAIALFLNLASEWVSFSKLINGSPVLSYLDRAGAPHRSR